MIFPTGETKGDQNFPGWRGKRNVDRKAGINFYSPEFLKNKTNFLHFNMGIFKNFYNICVKNVLIWGLWCLVIKILDRFLLQPDYFLE